MPTRLCEVICLFALAVCITPCDAQTPASPQATADCKSTVVGDLEKRTFTSTTFGDPQTLLIWLPPGYNDPANAQKQYPVLYMMDGENLFDACTSSFHHEWQIDETLTRLIANNEVEPLIVVGINSPASVAATSTFLTSIPSSPHRNPTANSSPTSLQTKSCPSSLASSASSKIPTTPPSEAPPTGRSPPCTFYCTALISSASACSKAPHCKSETVSFSAIRPRSQSAREESPWE